MAKIKYQNKNIDSVEIVEINDEVSTQDIVDKYASGDVIVYKNGKAIKENEIIKKDDNIILSELYLGAPTNRGGARKKGLLQQVLGAALVVVGVVLAATQVGGALGANLIISGVGFFLSGTKLKKTNFGQDIQQVSTPAELPAYSLSSGGNRQRAGASLPLILGNYRFFPDHGMQPYAFFDNITGTISSETNNPQTIFYYASIDANTMKQRANNGLVARSNLLNNSFIYTYADFIYRNFDNIFRPVGVHAYGTVDSNAITLNNFWKNQANQNPNITIVSGGLINGSGYGSTIANSWEPYRLGALSIDVTFALSQHYYTPFLSEPIRQGDRRLVIAWQDAISFNEFLTSEYSRTLNYLDPAGHTHSTTFQSYVVFLSQDSNSDLHLSLTNKFQFDQWYSGGAYPSAVIELQGFDAPDNNVWTFGPVGFNQVFSKTLDPYHGVVVTNSDVTGNHLLHQIFNFGLGDLTLSDHRIENTPFNYYRNVNLKFSKSFETQTSYPLPLSSSPYVHGNVDSVQVGKLTNNASFSGPTSAVGSMGSAGNFYRRESPLNVYQIELDIIGRLYYQDQNTGAIGNYSVSFEIQYKRVTDSTWIALAGVSTFIISNDDLDMVRLTIRNSTLYAGTDKYEVRIRKIDLDGDQKAFICDLECSEIRFFQTDSSNYIGQNRVAVEARATEQFNGAIGKFNSYIQAKCFIFDFNLQSWSWGFSENPAFWFLYFAKGIWKNSSNTTSSAFPDSPTMGWTNNSDNLLNEKLMAGCGLLDEDIDLQSILSWAQFCDTKNLKMSGIVDENENCFDVLNEIATTGRANVSWRSGKLGVVFEDELENITAIFGIHNILKDSFSVSYSNQDLPDKITATFSDESKNFEISEVSAIRPDIFLGGSIPRKTSNIHFKYIKNQAQAQREVNILAARQYYQRRTITFDTDYDSGLQVTRGDVISVQHDITSWEFSAKPIKFIISSGLITEIVLDREVPSYCAWAQIRRVDGSLDNVQVSTNGNSITLLSPLSSTIAPFYIDEVSQENSSSIYDNSFPEDWIILLGVSSTPSKKCRVTQVVPKSLNVYTITCTDEEAAMWAYEYLGTQPLSNQIMTIAKVTNTGAESADSGKIKLWWELENAIAARVDYRILPTTAWAPVVSGGTITQFNSSIDLFFPSGSVVEFNIAPIVISAPYQAISQSLTIEVE